MNKLLTKIVGLALGLSMAIGVGVAASFSAKDAVKADAESTINFTAANSGGWTTSQQAQSGTIDGVTLAVTNGTINTTLRFYASQTITISSTVGNITSVVFTASQGSWSSPSEGTISGLTWTGSASSFTATVGTQIRASNVAITVGGSASDWETTAIAIAKSSNIEKTIYNTTTAFPTLNNVTITKTEHDKNEQAEDRDTDVTADSTLHWMNADNDTDLSLPLSNGSYNIKIWASVTGETLTSKDNETASKQYVTGTLTVTDEPSYVLVDSIVTSGNMTGNNDANSKFGLSNSDWSIVGTKQSASNLPGFGSDGTTRLYGNKSGGNYIVIKTLKANRYIVKISIEFNGSYGTGAEVREGEGTSGTTVSKSGGYYTFSDDLTAFTLINVNNGTTQVRFDTIHIYYEDVQVSTPLLEAASAFNANIGSNTLEVTYSNFTAGTAINASSDATGVATVTSSVNAPSTSGTVNFTVTGVSAGSATLTITSTGANTLTISVSVYQWQEFTRITMTSKLVSGGHYLIAKTNSNNVMSTTQNSNNRGETEVAGTSPFSTLTTQSASAAVLTFTSGTGEYSDYFTIYDPVNAGYLYDPNVTDKNYLRTDSTVSGDTYYWSIEFTGNNVNLVNKGSAKSLQCNGDIFSDYSTTQTAIELYLLTSELPSDVNITSFTMPSGSISFENLDSYVFTATYSDPAATETVTASIGTGSVGSVTFGSVNMSSGTLTVTLTGQSAGLVYIVLTGDRSGTTAQKAVTVIATSRIYDSGLLTKNSVSTTLGGSVATNGVTWYTNDATMQNEEHEFTTATDTTKGVGLGTADKPISTFEMTSDLFVGVDYNNKGAHLISSIIVKAAIANGGNATLSVEVDGTQVGSTQTLTVNPESYVFTLSSYASGHISVKVSNSAAKAVYIGSIIVKGYFDSEDSEVYYSMAKQLEAIDSCNVSQTDWETFLATEDSYFEMTYGEIFEVSETDFTSISLFDHASKDGESLKTTTWDAYSKYIYINSRFESGSGVKLFSLFEDPNTSITIIVAISAISLTSVGAFFALRKRKENI